MPHTNSRACENQAVSAQVSYSGSTGFGAVGASELRDIPVFAPRGIAYAPCEGDRLLLMPVEGRMSCIGALSPTQGLQPGELRLGASGNIYIKQNGDVVINGVTITKSGEIVAPQGG